MRLIVFLMVLWTSLCSAEQSLGEQAYAIAAQLRDPASVNQTLAESETQIAYELKGRIGQMLAEGKNRQQIETALVARYGEQIRYQPPFSLTTAMLWILPLALLLLGVIAVWRQQRASTRSY
ncbi:cytochrome c-type biogenesis protein [Ferrimonas lipolytica]|nr:cytochrome c-type biogenesis protein CcmH [Ferrimonas lipolytica]